MNKKEFLKLIPIVVRCEICHGEEGTEICGTCGGIGFKVRNPSKYSDILLLDAKFKT